MSITKIKTVKNQIKDNSVSITKADKENNGHNEKRVTQ